jgi:hypothetical protein
MSLTANGREETLMRDSLVTGLRRMLAERLSRPIAAKRLECAELAPAFEGASPLQSAGKPGALQTLRDKLRPGI